MLYNHIIYIVKGNNLFCLTALGKVSKNNEKNMKKKNDITMYGNTANSLIPNVSCKRLLKKANHNCESITLSTANTIICINVKSVITVSDKTIYKYFKIKITIYETRSICEIVN